MTEIENKGKIPEDDNTGINKGKLATLMKAKHVQQIQGSHFRFFLGEGGGGGRR